MLLDLAKAYNRGSPRKVLLDLFDMHTPGFLLAIIASYMTGRTMRLNYNGSWSKPQSMPGSFSQGCYLFMLLFIVQFNGALLRPPVPKCICSASEKECNDERVNFMKRKGDIESISKTTTAKFLDDISAAGAYNLKEDVEVNTDIIRPLNYN